MKSNALSTPVVEVDALVEGIKAALDLYIREAHLANAVGETGKIRVTLELDLNRGRVQRSKGACWFERYMDLGGRNV